jgi:hypothetical protein
LARRAIKKALPIFRSFEESPEHDFAKIVQLMFAVRRFPELTAREFSEALGGLGLARLSEFFGCPPLAPIFTSLRAAVEEAAGLAADCVKVYGRCHRGWTKASPEAGPDGPLSPLDAAIKESLEALRGCELSREFGFCSLAGAILLARRLPKLTGREFSGALGSFGLANLAGFFGFLSDRIFRELRGEVERAAEAAELFARLFMIFRESGDIGSAERLLARLSERAARARTALIGPVSPADSAIRANFALFLQFEFSAGFPLILAAGILRSAAHLPELGPQEFAQALRRLGLQKAAGFFGSRLIARCFGALRELARLPAADAEEMLALCGVFWAR